MELKDIMSKEVGTIEPKKLSEGKVKITSMELQEENKEKKKMATPLLHLKVKHPEKDDLIAITKIKFLDGDKLVTAGLWVQLDSEQKIQKSSTVDRLLKFLGVKTLEETFTKEIETVFESEKSSYLALKCYK